MSRNLSILHIASFTGNVGDYVNHMGTSVLFNEYFHDLDITITRKEIREMYWGLWHFNSEEFVEMANQYDLLMIGGGNYFELWVEKSSTGCTIDLNPKILSKIKTPILFYSLGIDIGMGYSESTKKKFKQFMDTVCSSDQFFVSVRNDGSMGTMKRLYGERYNEAVTVIPDGGFFVGKHPRPEPEFLAQERKNIVINLAGDMLDRRFSKGSLSYEDSMEMIAQAINTFFEEQGPMQFIFVPHIFRDYDPIYKIIDKVNDPIRRRHIAVAANQNSVANFEEIMNLYGHADLIIGNRFHSNVMAYAFSKPHLGLINYPQIEYLYKEMEDVSCITIADNKFTSSELTALMAKVSASKNNVFMDKVKTIKDEGYAKLKNWIESIIGRD